MRTARSVSLFAVLSTLLILSSLCFGAADRITAPITSAATVSLGNGFQPAFWPKQDQGSMDASFVLHNLTLVIAPSPAQQRGIDKLLAQQQDPTSPYYHQWLTPEQYGQRFGLSSNDIRKITAWLMAEGFNDITVARSSNLISFSGTVSNVEKTFQTQIHQAQVDGRMQFFNVSPPHIPAALSGIVAGMRGLSNFHLKSSSIRRKASYYDPATSFGGQVLAPADIATIYNIGAGMDGTGQTLAIVGQTDIFEADIADFRSGFNLLPAISGCTSSSTSPNVITACNTAAFRYVLTLPTGGADPLAPDSIGDDLPEADLDIQWSGAAAPKAQVIYVNAPDVSGNGVIDAMIYAITNNVAPVVSMSYDLCELGVASLKTQGFLELAEADFKQANLQGMTIVNSSGDNGVAACDSESAMGGNPALLGYSVNYPASSPEVTGVGGTLIPIDSPSGEYSSPFWNNTGTIGGSAQKYVPEQGWNDALEFAIFCEANKSNGFCSGNGLGGGPLITDWINAQVNVIGISGGGGGVSNCATIDSNGVCTGGFPQPSYQSKLDTSAVNPGGVGEVSASTPTRYVPDVSLMASANWPGYIFCTPLEELSGTPPYDTETTSSCATSIADSVAGIVSGNQFVVNPSLVGGTSVASPIFAGIVALLNQAIVAKGIQKSPGLSNINPMLYSLAASASNGAFNPVDTPTTGAYSNGVFCTPGTPTSPVVSDPWPTGLQCPAAAAGQENLGLMTFGTNNFDATTKYNLVTGLGSVNVSNLVSAYTGASLATTSTTLMSSANPVNFGDPVTFTATVTTTGSTPPTGSVTFNNGSTSIGSGTLSTTSPYQATLMTSSLPAGTDSITAVYGGDSSNASSTSNTVSEVVNPPQFKLSTPTPPTAPLAGQTTTSTFNVSAIGSSTFAGAVTFQCVLPSGAVGISCTFMPSQIAAGAPSPVNNVVATLTTTGPNTGSAAGGAKQQRRRADNRTPWLPMTLPLAGVVMLGIAGRKRYKYSMVGSMCVTLLLLGLLIACGGSSSSPPVSIGLNQSGATVFANYQADNWLPVQGASFMATVMNSSNTGVNWSLGTAVSGVSCTASSNPCGTISAGTGDMISYTAPTIAVGLPGTVSLTAQSQADTSKTATATITITPTTVPTAILGTGPYSVGIQATEAGNPTPVTPTVSLTVK